MKLTDIRIHVLKSALQQPFVFSQGWVRQALFHAGRTGHRRGPGRRGEAFAQGWSRPRSLPR